MGMVVDGKWELGNRKPDAKGRFVRTTTKFRNWITADGSSGFNAEPGRYHLYISWACPWAHRTVIMRRLKNLDDAISLSVVDHFMGEKGWRFRDVPGTLPDTVNNADYMHEIYIKAQPDYTGRASVPALWDKQTGTIVSNESREIVRMLDTEFDTNGTTFYPEPLRESIDRTIDEIYEPINNGVYRSGFSVTQEAYEQAVTELFQALEHWNTVLDTQRYLCGDVITEADWCLFPTLIRFDLVYYGHFKCNLGHIQDFSNLWNYLKELYQVPGVAGTCNLEHMKAHYYGSHETVNPTRIVPMGPRINFDTAHDRDSRSYSG